MWMKISKYLPKRKTDSEGIVPIKFDECGRRVFRNEKVCKYFLQDVLGIPAENIKSIRFLDTYLPGRHRKQKRGILDILVEMNNDAKINIEIQLKYMKRWDKRQLFYLSRLYTDELIIGEKYEKLKRCIGISILDFNLTDREEYHNVYYLQDDEGHHLSEDFEIHTIELKKKLKGDNPLDDWVRLFNAQSEEELDMIKTDNIGIREAIMEVKRYSLVGLIRQLYREHVDYIRDNAAVEDYIREEGEERFAHLTQLLIDDNRSEDLSRAIADKSYRELLYQEYGL